MEKRTHTFRARCPRLGALSRPPSSHFGAPCPRPATPSHRDTRPDLPVHSASALAASAADALARAAAALDARLRLRSRAASAASATAAAAREADERFGLSAKGRAAAQDAARAAPRYARAARDFLNGPAGPFALAAALALLAYTGWLARLLNLCVLLWFAAPLLGLPAASMAAARARAAEADARAEIGRAHV